MSTYKRPAVVFNMDNPMQRDLYEWCIANSNNFSDFARSVLLLYKQSKTFNMGFNPEPHVLKPSISEDANAMADML